MEDQTKNGLSASAFSDDSANAENSENTAGTEATQTQNAETAGKPKLGKSFVRFFTAKNIAYLAVLTALEIVLLFWGSAIPVGTGGATLNFSLLPIVLGAMLLGPVAGAFLGLVSGIVISIMVVVGLQGPVFLYLFNLQPVVIILICLLKTTAAGFVSGLLYAVLRKKNQYVAVFVSAIAAPIVNTGLFILGCLCIGGAIEQAAEYYGFAYATAFNVIILIFVTYNFFIELAINLVFAPALCTVVRVVEKQLGNKKSVKNRQTANTEVEAKATTENKTE